MDLQARQEARERQAEATEGSLVERVQDLERRQAQERQEWVSAMEQQSRLNESRQAVEKQDVLTKLAELRENSNEADSAASLMIEAVTSRLQSSVDELRSAEGRERIRLRDAIDERLQDLSQGLAAATEGRTSHTAALQQKVDSFQEKQVETLRNLKAEVGAMGRDMQTMLRTEVTQRADTEHQIGANLREGLQYFSRELATTKHDLHLKVEQLSRSVGEHRTETGTRMDQVSRYVDQAVHKIDLSLRRSREAVEVQVNALNDKVNGLTDRVERVHELALRRADQNQTDFQAIMQRVETNATAQVEGALLRCERLHRQGETRSRQAETDISSRMQLYTQQFDRNIASLQQALLALSKARDAGRQIVHEHGRYEEIVSGDGREQEIPEPPPVDTPVVIPQQADEDWQGFVPPE